MPVINPVLRLAIYAGLHTSYMILLLSSYNYITLGGVINPCYAGDESCATPCYLFIEAERAEMTSYKSEQNLPR